MWHAAGDEPLIDGIDIGPGRHPAILARRTRGTLNNASIGVGRRGGGDNDGTPMARILVTEEIAEGGLDRLRAAGHEVDVQLDLSPDELFGAVKGAHALIIRSATKVTSSVLDTADTLVVVGRAGIGLDNVDVEHATKRGVM